VRLPAPIGMSILIIANANARALIRSPRRLCELEAISHGHADLRVTRSVAELDEVLEGAHLRRLVIFAGGDGSFMAGTTALLSALDGRPAPVIGLAPMGTVGTTARNFGERGDPLVLVERWIRAYAQPGDANETRVVLRPTLRVAERRRAASERTTRFGFIFGTGLVARFFEVYEAEGAGGTALAGRLVARIFAESIVGGPLAKRILTPLACELEVDGVPNPSRGFSLLLASVVRDLGLGMKVSYRAGERTDRIHLVASSLLPRDLGPRMPYVLMGRSIGGEGHVDVLAERFTVRFAGESGPYVLDGDSFSAREVEVSAGPVLPIIGPRTP